MARNKVKLAWIVNDSSRRATFKKRKQGVLKKTSELGILCGTDTCIILYNPYSPQPDLYPNNVDEVTRILSRLSILPEVEQKKNMMNHERYLRDRIKRTLDQKNKVDGQIHDLHLNLLFHEYLRGRDVSDLKDEDLLKNLIWIAENKLRDAAERIQKLRNQNQPSASVPPPPATLHGQERMLPCESDLPHHHIHHLFDDNSYFDHHHLSENIFQPSASTTVPPASTSFLPQPPSTTVPQPSHPTGSVGNDDESDGDEEEGDTLEVTAIVENLADDNDSDDSPGAGGELLFYPPHMLSAPEDLGHAYVHPSKPKDP